MAQILIFGASTAYGVGGTKGGWPDALKFSLHDQMYGVKTMPLEKHEVYNLCVPGATVAHIQERMAVEIKGFSKAGRDTIVVIELGGNDAKAMETTENFANTPEKFYGDMKSLVSDALNLTKKVLLVGMLPVDESKTTPRTNPNNGNKTYFTNKRMRLFEDVLEKVAADTGIGFTPLFDKATEDDWQNKLIFDDGLHPNSNGHTWLLEKIKPALEKFLEP